MDKQFERNVAAAIAHTKTRARELGNDRVTDNADVCAALYLIDKIECLTAERDALREGEC